MQCMFQEKRSKTILILIILFVIVAGYFLLHKFENQISNLPKETTPSLQPPTDIQKYGTSTEAYNSYVGVITQNANGQNVYTSSKYHLSFTYPQGWRVGDNHLGYGSFQIFNFEPEIGQKGFLKGQNKIEAGIAVIDPHDFGKNTDFPEGYSTTTKVTIAGEPSIRFDINYPAGGVRLFSYIIPIPDTLNNYIGISIYGDPSNFYVLNDLVKSLEWLK